MRVRKRKGAEEHLANHPQYVILEPEAAKGKWHQIFGNDNPIHIEVGSGKGAFITGMAQQNPDINYIGIDIQLSVLSYALDKVLASGVENVKLLRVDGSALTNYFEDGEVDMTYKTFLDTYKQILPKNGEIHLKTDNRGFFEYSLTSFSQYGMILNKVWLDLHASDYEGNVMTEYERKFSEKGQAIYRVEAQFKD